MHIFIHALHVLKSFQIKNKMLVVYCSTYAGHKTSIPPPPLGEKLAEFEGMTNIFEIFSICHPSIAYKYKYMADNGREGQIQGRSFREKLGKKTPRMEKRPLGAC